MRAKNWARLQIQLTCRRLQRTSSSWQLELLVDHYALVVNHSFKVVTPNSNQSIRWEKHTINSVDVTFEFDPSWGKTNLECLNFVVKEFDLRIHHFTISLKEFYWTVLDRVSTMAVPRWLFAWIWSKVSWVLLSYKVISTHIIQEMKVSYVFVPYYVLLSKPKLVLS